MRSLWQNFELGISAAMSRMVLEPHLLFFVFCVLLACAVWARYRQPLYRLFSLFPVSAALVLGVLGGPLRALAPRLSFFADAVTEKGTLTPLNAWTLKRWLPFLLLCAVLFACALELYLALGMGRRLTRALRSICRGSRLTAPWAFRRPSGRRARVRVSSLPSLWRPRARWCCARCRRNGCRGGCSVVRQPCARWRNVSRSSGHRAVFGGRNDRFLMLKIFKPGRFTARLF